MGTILLGWAIAQQGENESGIALMRQGIVDWQAAGAASQVPYFLALLAATHGRAEQAEAGLAVIADALAVIEQTGERAHEAELQRLNGERRWQAGASAAEVATLFQRARSVAQQQQAKSLEL